MTAQLEIYDELADLLAKMAPAKVVALAASEKQQSRLEDLLEKNRDGILTPEEDLELERMLLFNRVVGLAKIRALHLLKNESENTPTA